MGPEARKTMAKNHDNEDPTLVDQGPRSFAVLLTELDAGQYHRDITEYLQRLMRAIGSLNDEGHDKVKGKLTLTLSFTGRRDGKMEITPDVKVAAPKKDRVQTIRWLNKHGNLEKADPRQQELALRDVGGGKKTPRDVGTGVGE
jgi:hypothetical protein